MLGRLACVVSMAVLALGCGSSDDANAGGGGSGGAAGDAGSGDAGAGGAGGAAGDAGTDAGGNASFKWRGSVEQVHVWKAPAGTKLELVDAQGDTVQSGTTDELGSLIFRKVQPGDGYVVRAPELSPVETTAPIHVMSVANSLPPSDFYAKQTLVAGENYITTRDGTTLAVYVTLPGPAEDGPYPTVVNYSGYNPAEPGKLLDPSFQSLCGNLPALCDAPNDPSALIAALMGYATVGVNMRGTGCSGGAYDFFEELQLLDGYDAIETVAAQPWVYGHKVGMTGLSYPGISQLFVAETHPPSLAAITPLSVIGNTYTTGMPGGIFNDGFALDWITNVVDKADPYGQGWEKARVDAGDAVCEENQLLHGQKVNVIEKAKSNPYYTDDVAAPLNPTAFVDQIDVPVFLAGSFEDEQTGPYFFTLLDRFASSPLTRFTVYNGVHPDGFAPQVLVEWKAFLDLYVAHQIPKVPDKVRLLGPQLFKQVFGVPISIPPDRFASYPTFDEAKAAFEAEQPLRAIFENGYGDPQNVGAPVGTFDERFDAWPPPATTPTRFYLHADGSLDATAPTEAASASTFELDPDAGERGILPAGVGSDEVWKPDPTYAWSEPPAGKDVVFETAPLADDLVMLGTASVDLWIRSPVDDADLEVNVTEVRPDGQERYVQSGWLRASLRKLATNATDLWPEHTYRKEDEALLVPGDWTAVRIGVPAFDHIFRKGSRIRVLIDTPGDSRAAWKFALKTFPGSVSYDVAHSSAYPSSVVFPVLAGQKATTPMPPCPSLRAMQCRTYAPYANVATANP